MLQDLAFLVTESPCLRLLQRGTAKVEPDQSRYGQNLALECHLSANKIRGHNFQ